MALVMMMLMVWVAVVAALCDARSLDDTASGQQLMRDVFYAELRDLLNRNGDAQVPIQHDVATPVRPARPREVAGWGQHLTDVGQVSGVAVNPRGEPVIFHRGDRVWNDHSFNESNFFLEESKGPISADTILTLDPATGDVLHSWGKDLFYLPHGITIDSENNIWLTDVALHQVFKFPPGFTTPALVFGTRFLPGSSSKHLCKPSSVAVATSGEVFIADGYCNSRVLKFDANGELLRMFPQPPEFLSLQVPHSLALVESLDLICIADRENMRVTCPKAGLGGTEEEGRLASPPVTIQEPDLGRVFAVAALGDVVYAVNGPTSRMFPVRGFTLDPKAETIVDHWSPEAGFHNPHDIAISPDGTKLYVAEIGPNKVWKFELANTK